jgi:hypothetical protein
MIGLPGAPLPPVTAAMVFQIQHDPIVKDWIRFDSSLRASWSPTLMDHIWLFGRGKRFHNKNVYI